MSSLEVILNDREL